MLFVIDLDTLYVIEAARDKRPVSLISGKRGDGVTFQVMFVRSGITEELPAASVITFGAKQNSKYDAPAVVLHSDFALSGSGETAVYSGSPSFNTVALNALLFIDENDSNDPEYVDLMAEFTWQVADGSPTSTKTFRFRVHNDVIRDREIVPAALSTVWAAPIVLTAPPVDGVAGVAANSTLSIPGGLPAPGATLTIAGRVYTWRAASTSSASEIVIGSTVADTIYNLNYALNAPAFGTANADVLATGLGATTLIIQARVAGTASNGLTVSSSAFQVICSNLAGGVNAITGTAATALGQLAIVTHTDGSQTEWGCVRVTSVKWLPRTPGVLLNTDTGLYERTVITAGSFFSTPLPV